MYDFKCLSEFKLFRKPRLTVVAGLNYSSDQKAESDYTMLIFVKATLNLGDFFTGFPVHFEEDLPGQEIQCGDRAGLFVQQFGR